MAPWPTFPLPSRLYLYGKPRRLNHGVSLGKLTPSTFEISSAFSKCCVSDSWLVPLHSTLICCLVGCNLPGMLQQWPIIRNSQNSFTHLSEKALYNNTAASSPPCVIPRLLGHTACAQCSLVDRGGDHPVIACAAQAPVEPSAAKQHMCYMVAWACTVP